MSLDGKASVVQQGGTVNHSARTATGTETAFLTAKSDQFFIVAGFAANPEKTVLKPSAFQVFIKLFLDVYRWEIRQSFYPGGKPMPAKICIGVARKMFYLYLSAVLVQTYRMFHHSRSLSM